ncbi:MAG TPA: DUF6160 family protein [Candidatus Acidoferrales bacterium]|nr:DUF6160 family protein [Candidatus Acidoferrales bacterium]
MRYLMLAMVAMTVALPVQAEMRPLADEELRAVSGQAGTLVYDPPPFVDRLDALSQSLADAGHPVAAALIGQQARFLGRVFDGCPRGAYCAL